MNTTYIISGAGSGIGRAVATKLAESGSNLILTGRSIASLQETKNMLEGAQNECYVLDICDRSACMSLAHKLSGKKIDGIIANAGIGGENSFGNDDRWDEIIATNLTGTYNFVSALVPLLSTNKHNMKHIVIMSSVLARLGVRNYTAYCASKSGLLGLMRSWAVELASQNILVNAIAPGWVATDMSKQGIEGIARDLSISSEEFHEIAMQSVPLGKMSQPAEIAQLAHYLLNQSSMTGQCLDINGGSVMNS